MSRLDQLEEPGGEIVEGGYTRFGPKMLKWYLEWLYERLGIDDLETS